MSVCQYRCVHYGEPRKRGKGIRPTQHHFALQCPAELHISYDHNVKKFTVRRCNLNHCHPIGRDILPHYPFNRRLDSDQISEVRDIVSFGPKIETSSTIYPQTVWEEDDTQGSSEYSYQGKATS